MLIDTHCHLDFPDFATEGLEAIIERARAAGVTRMITISTRVKRFDVYRAIAERFDNVFCTVGTHPHQAAEEPDVTVDDLVRLSAHKKCVGIGEAGLDYFYDKAPREQQAKSLRIHITAARETKLPLVIHARNADEDMMQILTEETAQGAFPAVLHCFSSGRALAMRGLDLGLYLSLSGILTFKNSEEIRQIVRDVPIDRLLVETDAPYLAPLPHRGKRNEPAFSRHTAEILASVKGVTFEEIAAATTANADRLFWKLRAA